MINLPEDIEEDY